MAIEQMSEMMDEESRNMELYKMKNELLLFVTKMKSEGFLASVDFQDVPDIPDRDRTDW